LRQKAADLELAEARQKLQEKMMDAEKLTRRLMGLKFRMEDYFRAEKSKYWFRVIEKDREGDASK